MIGIAELMVSIFSMSCWKFCKEVTVFLFGVGHWRLGLDDWLFDHVHHWSTMCCLVRCDGTLTSVEVVISKFWNDVSVSLISDKSLAVL